MSVEPVSIGDVGGEHLEQFVGNVRRGRHGSVVLIRRGTVGSRRPTCPSRAHQSCRRDRADHGLALRAFHVLPRLHSV